MKYIYASRGNTRLGVNGINLYLLGIINYSRSSRHHPISDKIFEVSSATFFGGCMLFTL